MENRAIESTIVDQFGSLQVVTSYGFVNMEKLVQDLSSALDESSKARSSDMVLDHMLRRQTRKRRVLKRRSASNPGSSMTEHGNKSEASQSSFDEAVKDYFDNIALHSDSDDILVTKRLSTCSLPVLNNLSLHESDSVNETFSPMRQRRRRKFKQMAVDPEPVAEVVAHGARPKHRRTKSRNPAQVKDSPMCGVLTPSNTSRKRPMGRDVTMQDPHSGASTMDCQQEQEEESSSLGSSDTDDGIFTFDEGQDGDDEQSDFFHESGPTYGIPGIIPWWEKDKQKTEDTDPVFEKILKGSFEYLPKNSQNSYRLRAAKFLNKHNKEIGSSRKRYRGRATRSRISSKTDVSTKYSLWPMAASSSEVKRRRKTPSPSVSNSGCVGGNAPPLPSSNIGRQMLENMGWSPGDGLGLDGSGIKNPVHAFLRPRRQGLGHSKQTKSS